MTIRKLEEEILAAGHSVCILTTASGDPANTHQHGEHPNRQVIFMEGIPIPFLADPNNPELTYQLGFSLTPAVLAQMQDFDPTIIHITCPDCTALHLIQYARQYEVPIMGTYHSNIPEYMEHYPGLGWLKHILATFFRHQYNFLQGLYVPTPFIQRHLEQTYQMSQATNVGIWGRGVDVEMFHPKHASHKFRRDLGISDSTVLLCWVGRLVPEKRPDIFADAVRRLEAEGCDFHAAVIGAGPAEDMIKGLPKTTFCGWMNMEQLSVAYASSDVFLFPSSVETFGNVTLEAMASGLPVIVEAGCSGHLVENDENGYACTTPEEFIDATLELVTNDAKRRAFSNKSREMSLQLEKKVVVRQMLDHYTEVTNEFFNQYNGRHSNRDKAYKFRAGNHPRPMVLICLEYLFVVLFQVIWNMMQAFTFMQNALRRSRPTIPIVSKTPAAAASVVDVSEVDLEDPLSETASKTDDATDSTTSSSQKSAPERPLCTECRAAHVIAKGTMRAFEFQCRMESMLRNGASSCWTRTKNLGAKRKNSSFSEEDALPVASSPDMLLESKHRQRRHVIEVV